jgi:hypothetical protein
MKFSKPLNRWFYVTYGILYLTGISWIISHFALDPANPFSPFRTAETWILRAHAAFAFGSLIILGALIPIHFVLHWKFNKNKKSGATITAILGLQIISGYGLYYATTDALRNTSEWAHIIIGIGLPLILIWHILAGKKATKTT